MDHSNWIHVGALADGFLADSHILPPADRLAGRTLNVYGEDGSIVEYRFESATRLHWGILAPDAPDAKASETYRATSLREGIVFIDFVKSGERAGSVSMVIDLGRAVVTTITGTLPTREAIAECAFDRATSGRELTSVKASIVRGTLGNSFDQGAQLHQRTTELVGMRNEYIYSATERYEHIYLNEHYYSWQCLDGVEQGLGDTDRCDYLKIADALYLFIWREKIVPTLGVVMIDLEKHKTDGKIFGYAGQDIGQTSNFAVGAHAHVLNQTRHAPLSQRTARLGAA
ncbi:MAG TPA: molybdenum cofactor biosynthesis F family protein [Burkholderiales bacterium]|nr:molybdenum cofactor biosynthesis F family protein [Burkholderiales bacterium]